MDRKDTQTLLRLDEAEFEALLEKKAEEFEEHLIKTEKDTLQRALKRKNFYQEQRDLRAERIRVLGIDAKRSTQTTRVIRKRQFEAFGGKKYHGTIISEEMEQEHEYMKERAYDTTTEDGNPRYPVFLGEDGTLYDKNYLPIKPRVKEVLDIKRGRFSKVIALSEEQSKLDDGSEWGTFEFCHDPDLYENPPDPESFETFEEYEDALIAWSKEVQKMLGYLQLPRIMGRHYYRQYVLKPEQQQKQMSENNKQVKKDEKDLGFQISKTLNMEETWESQLIPLEPKPEFYETFEEYEKAMLRWACVCCGVRFLPPHPAQFQKLLGIKLNEKPDFPVADIDLDEREDHILTRKTVRAKTSRKVEVKKVNIEELRAKYTIGNEWEKIKQEDKNKVIAAIDRYLQKAEQSYKKYNCYHNELYPIIHGTFPGDDKLMRRLSLTDLALKLGDKKKESPQNVREWIQFQRRERSLSSVFAQNTMPYYQAIAEDLKHQIPLRRTDLTEEEKKRCLDCDENVQNKAVKFKVPEFDIGQIDFLKLNTNSYVRFLQILLIRIDQGSRYENLNSWYYPKVPEEVWNQKITELAKILKVEHPSQIDARLFTEVFLTDAPLDIFTKWLATNLPQRMFVFLKGKEEELKCYMHLLFAATNVPHFKHILSMFDNSNSKLVHAKISEYILEFMKTKLAETDMDTIIKERDLESLYHVSRAVTFYDEVPIELFVYEKHTRHLVIQLMGNDVDSLIIDLMSIYYLDTICVSLLEEDKVFKNVYPLLISHIERLIDRVIWFLQNNENFLGNQIWNCLGHRSVELSRLAYFILSFLFVLSYNPKILQLLRHPNTCLVDNIRTLARSRFSHVQTYVARLFPILRNKKWNSLLTDTYSKAKYVVKDLVTAASVAALDSQPPLVSSMVLEFFEHVFKIKKNQSDSSKLIIQGLIKTDCFSKVLAEVLKTYHEKNMHQGTIMGSIFLSKLAKYAICNELIAVRVDKTNVKKGFTLFKKKQKDDSQGDGAENKYFIITDTIIESMIDFITNPGNNNRRFYRPKTYMLECLRHLLKCHEVFNKLIKLNRAFVQKLIDICKDGTEMEFNRNAWRLFYQLFKFHPNVVEKIIKNGQMTAFLEMIGSGQSSVVMKNSIHYFNKIFNLPPNTNKPKHEDDDDDDDDEGKRYRTKKGWNVPSEECVKGYEKTVNALSQFIISKHLFVIIHMAYKRLSMYYNGWPFQSLVRFYETLNTHSACTKLVTAFKKQEPAYKEGLQHIIDMIGDEKKDKKKGLGGFGGSFHGGFGGGDGGIVIQKEQW